jgi:hypothetical protein
MKNKGRVMQIQTKTKQSMAIILFIMAAVLSIVLVSPGCKSSSDTPNPPVPPQPPEPPALEEQLIGKMFYHDTGPQSQFDIYMADLYIVPQESAAMTQTTNSKLQIFRPSPDRDPIVRDGIHKYHEVEINGKIIERVVLRTAQAVDMTQYNFEIRNVENLTNSATDDFAVNVNGNNTITFVTDPDGYVNSVDNTEIAYMNLDDRVRHQLTPINGQYSGNNFDPDWKTDDTIIWTHDGKIVEVNIYDLDVSDPIIPGVDTSQYDPKYSPDGTMILFNTGVRVNKKRKKNSHIKYLVSGQLVTVLPTAYYNIYQDDNPTWVFSNSLITGHIYMPTYGRIYTRNIQTDEFLVITDGAQDFRYVTPIQVDGVLYLIFSDWTDKYNIKLWISNENGTYLRELNQTGDEAVFRALGLPVPYDKEDMNEIARRYTENFEMGRLD